MRALSYRPFYPIDGRRVSLGDLSAAHRYTTTDAGISATKPHDVLPAELTYAATQGLSNAVVLAAATSQAAASCHLANRKGHIKPGHDADILAIPGNPMHTIEAILRPRAIFRLGQRIQ
jgi:imidazolonepropionase-like amidohydrolase